MDTEGCSPTYSPRSFHCRHRLRSWTRSPTPLPSHTVDIPPTSPSAYSFNSTTHQSVSYSALPTSTTPFLASTTQSPSSVSTVTSRGDPYGTLLATPPSCIQSFASPAAYAHTADSKLATSHYSVDETVSIANSHSIQPSMNSSPSLQIQMMTPPLRSLQSRGSPCPIGSLVSRPSKS